VGNGEHVATISNPYVLDLRDVDETHVGLVGGKGANLGTLARIDGLRVPPGFCVTTAAFRRTLAQAPAIDGLLDRLAQLDPGDGGALRELSAELRRTIGAIAVPDEVAAAIVRALARSGERAAYAVRSSATAEDSPTTSFAGQHDSFLNVSGPEAVLRHVSRAWASLFTERAVAYRVRNGLDHRAAHMAVVVQRMVDPQVAGVLFTADPVTGNRNVASVEAVPGLGEALVSGRVNADNYTVRGGEVVAKAVVAEQPALTDAQVVAIAQVGRVIEARLGRPQDVEWCLADGDVEIVQSRPITTLFPIPATDDDDHHVYVSVGHQQMMTDAMKPLGLSLFQLTAMATMHAAGGRLFVDVTERLVSPATREGLLSMLGKGDPLIGDALRTILQRADFLPSIADDGNSDGPAAPPASAPPAPIATDPAIVDELVERGRASLSALRRDIRTASGPALLDFILDDIGELKRIAFAPPSMQVIMAGMEATWWLNDQLEAWLGDKNAADILTQSVPGNITSEMGLALLDVADVIRRHPDVVDRLRGVEDDDFLDDLVELPGGRESRDAIAAFLDAYGMRCVGEIDITRPRWSERPSALVPVLLSNIRNFEPGAAARRFEQGREEARAKEQELLERLRALPDGARKADEAERMIARLRNFSGYREYPKYTIISRYFVYKQALLEEAARLVDAGVLDEKEDIFFLTFAELCDVVRTHVADQQSISRARQAFREHQALTPPRVLTSEGERLGGAYRRADAPAGALMGLAVSTGTVEGRARVVLDLADAAFETGDILVTAFTDPSWSPAFVAVEGLVTEVGGLMTHGAVIAREYGLPAVVGVERATRLIRDGQRIRVHGTDGYVELLS
jgi:rifampicin phosphotransferase